MVRKYSKVFVFVVLLPACTATKPQITNTEIGSAVTLSQEQRSVIEAGLKEMLDSPNAVSPLGTKAMILSGKPGVHVCGTVSAQNKELSFYIELRDKDGKPYAERGQIAFDPGKKAKIDFVCRHHA